MCKALHILAVNQFYSLQIAVNTRLLQKNNLEGIGRFTYETLRRIVLKNPDVDFIFFFDRKFHPDFIFAPNVKPIILYPQARHPFLYHIWFQYRIQKFLKQNKVDLFISPDGYIPLNTKTKTLSIIHDLAFEHVTNGVSFWEQIYYKKYFPKFAQAATRLATVSKFSKKDIMQTYQIDANKIDVVYNGVSESFLQLNNKKQPAKPYFIYIGSIHPRKNITLLLKAFELFKSKNPNLPHQLLLAGRLAWKSKEVINYINKMAFGKDVVFKFKLKDDELNKVINSATALVYPSVYEGFGLPIIEALNCGIPVITSKGTAMEEIAKGAATLFDPNNKEELAEKLFEHAIVNKTQADKINFGINVAKSYTWDKTADLLWQSILKTIN